jgi:hypothetical protein
MCNLKHSPNRTRRVKLGVVSVEMARYLEEELSFLDNYKDVFNDSMFQQSLL